MILGDREPIAVPRRCYRRDLGRFAPSGAAPLRPTGYTVRPVDETLFADRVVEVDPVLVRSLDVGHGSRQAFFRRELGAAAVSGGRMVAHCVTNRIHAGGGELGAFTRAEHRGRGLAGALVADLVRRGRARGLVRLEWHCDEMNGPSVRVAEKAGFERIGEYTVHPVYADPAVHVAMAGHHHDLAGRTEEALARFTRALGMEDCPDFAPVRAAGVQARLGREEEALRLLHLGIDRGYSRREPLLENAHYEALRRIEGFEAALGRIRPRPAPPPPRPAPPGS